jgi:mono/diheme cytochrome c family protein
MSGPMKLILFGAILSAVLVGETEIAAAQRTRPAFAAQGGEAVFKSICQGCHMPDAKGAVGAGAYPALAANPNLEAAGYPLTMVIQGHKAMPPFGLLLSDQQVVDVVNYVRTHFGNHYTDVVSLQDVKDLRAAR